MAFVLLNNYLIFSIMIKLGYSDFLTKLKLIIFMSIIANRLPAIKFLAIAGGIQLGLTLFSNVLHLSSRLLECPCLASVNTSNLIFNPILPSSSQVYSNQGTTINIKVNKDLARSLKTF